MVKNNNLVSIGGTLVVLGIIFGTDRLIGYSLIGAGVLVSILYWVRSRKREEL